MNPFLPLLIMQWCIVTIMVVATLGLVGGALILAWNYIKGK